MKQEPIKCGKGLLWYMKHGFGTKTCTTTDGKKVIIVYPTLLKK